MAEDMENGEIVLFTSKTTAANPQRTSAIVVIPKIVQKLLRIKAGDMVDWIYDPKSRRIYIRKAEGRKNESEDKTEHTNDLQQL